MNNKRKIIDFKKQKGSFLVEMMIGLGMSVVTVLSVMTIYAQVEGQKRTTVQVGQTVSNAAMAMFPLLHDAKMAGFGVNIPGLAGCNIYAYNANTSSNFILSMIPIQITDGGDNFTSDKISFTASSSTAYFSPVKLTSDYKGSEAVMKVDNRFGFNPGDLMISIDPSGKSCTLSQVTDVPGTPGKTDNLTKNTGMYTDPVTGEKVKAAYNQAGGIKDNNGNNIDYSAGTKVLNIGSAPITSSYYIENNQIKKLDALSGNTQVVGDNVVMLQAQYGMDMDLDGSVDKWIDYIDPVTNKSDFQYVKGIRMAIITRSPLREKKDVSASGTVGECSTTTNNEFNWSGGTMDISKTDADWKCYRYRMLQSTVPLRNLIWAN